jgi:hypothetical protein
LNWKKGQKDKLSGSWSLGERQYNLAKKILLTLLVGTGQVWGCGPDFPNWLLAQGDQAVLVAPEGNFAAELARLHLEPIKIKAIPPENGNGYGAQSVEAELTDLRKALNLAKMPDDEVTRICVQHQRQRLKVQEIVEAKIQPQTFVSTPLTVQIVEGLPPEFADYFEGLIAWHNPTRIDPERARVAWERLLARPENERPFKSTWAAFMLGKSWAPDDPEKSVGYFTMVRQLKKQGYRDSLGLAAASLGCEARVYLQQSNYLGAIERYLDQMASGDPTATNSLAMTAAKALTADLMTLRSLAKNSRTQKVITAYVISRKKFNYVYNSKSGDQRNDPSEAESPAVTWLKAVEEAGIADLDEAEVLALAAYRAGDMGTAARWIRHASASPVAQWLQAKLLVRAGKVQSAAALLARLSAQFPIIHEGTNAPSATERKDTLTAWGDCSCWRTSAERQVHGELGVLRLARGEYVQALDQLLNAGFWMDAAYVAERVLTLDELKNYVDRFWPSVGPEQIAQEQEQFAGSDVCPSVLREQIRYLLARRLTRELHTDQALDYYPAVWVGPFERMMACLRGGWDERASPIERAGAFYHGAMLTRTNGMELIGTEVAPDWHYHDGAFDWGVTGESRASNELATVVYATNDELSRNSEHHPDPDFRFHYRYQAASLAWEAAKLLRDNDDTTAYLLWQGGCFIKNRDPQLADIFYKALVRRNRRTLLGAEADRQRWFPVIDENGNIQPTKAIMPKGLNDVSISQPTEDVTDTTEKEALAESTIPGDQVQTYKYTLRFGDSLDGIVQGFAKAGVVVSQQEILAANPGLDPSRLKVGQVILVPERATPSQPR